MSTPDVVAQHWAVCEELLAARPPQPFAALAVLEALLASESAASASSAVPSAALIATRVRAAQIVTTAAGGSGGPASAFHVSPDAARRLLEPAIAVDAAAATTGLPCRRSDVGSGAVDLATAHVEALRLMSVVCRRKGAHKKAVEFLERARSAVLEWEQRVVVAAASTSSSTAAASSVVAAATPTVATRRQAAAAAATTAVLAASENADQRQRHSWAAFVAARAVVAHAQLDLELARAHFARCAESHFADADAAAKLVAATRHYVARATADVSAAASGDGDNDENVFDVRRLHVSRCVALCVCHVLGCVYGGEYEQALRHANQGAALFGALSEFTFLASLIAAAFAERGGGGGMAVVAAAVSPGATAASPQRKRDREQVADGTIAAEATAWLSDGCVAAVRALLALLNAGVGEIPDTTAAAAAAAAAETTDAASSSAEPTARGAFAAVMDACESQLRRLTAPGAAAISESGATVGSEIRLLVAVKVVAFSEAVSRDATALALLRAAERLEPMCAYLLLFQRHTIQFRFHAHMLIAAVAAAMEPVVGVECVAGSSSGHRRSADDDDDDGDGGDDDGGGFAVEDVAQRHLAVAAACAPDAASAVAARLALALLHHNRWLRPGAAPTAAARECAAFDALLEPLADSFAAWQQQQQQHDADDENQQQGGGGRGGWTPRNRALYLLLAGAQALQAHDHPAAIASLKAAMDLSRACFGNTSPAVAQCLRLLATAHSIAGNRQMQELALTTTMQLSAACADAAGGIHCMAWSLGHVSARSDGDRRRQATLAQQLDGFVATFAAEARGAAASPQWRRVATFLPERADYAAWVAHANSSGGGGGSAGGGGRSAVGLDSVAAVAAVATAAAAATAQKKKRGGPA